MVPCKQRKTCSIRINNLLVEANSDINSATDLQDIQAEINQLLTEINTIGEKTNFNGLTLLDGAFDTSEGSNPALIQVASPFGGAPTVVNANGTGNPNASGNPGPLIQTAQIPSIGGFNVPAFVVFTVVAAGDNLVDPDSGTVQFPGPGVIIQTDVYSNADPTTDPGLLATPLFTDLSAYPAGAGPNPAVFGGLLALFAGGSQNILSYAFNNVTEQDVGASQAFLITGAVGASNGRALTINDGGDEGQTLGISLPTINSNALEPFEYLVLVAPTDDNRSRIEWYAGHRHRCEQQRGGIIFANPREKRTDDDHDQ